MRWHTYLSDACYSLIIFRILWLRRAPFRYGHFNTTGPEIWEQTNGKVNAFVMATGTGA